MYSDPIADMLTRIRNGLQIELPFVDMPFSRLKKALADVLQREGFIWDSEIVEAQPTNLLRVNLKYGPNGERVITHIQRVSKPGSRIYSRVQDLRSVRNGTGIMVLTTPSGVLSNREARQQSVGGEVLAEVW
jgi:small subunit ribosomal protein S8